VTPDRPRVAPADVPAVLAVLADETRWRILAEIGAADLSASALAGRLPVSRQAIAKHLSLLADAGLVESVRVGREIRYRARGARLSALAGELESIGRQWDRRLAAIKRVVEQPYKSGP
jgi:DNA-binding transcriptional ArsR family regulator